MQDTVGEFWDEVGGRVGNTLRQAVLFLQEEQDFPKSRTSMSLWTPFAPRISSLL